MLTLKGVTKRYGDAAAVSAVDLDVPPNRTTVLIGPSGCGKSTLLRLMIALLAADEGTVQFEGVALSAASERDLLAQRQRIGYVIQDGGLFPHLTARANVTLMARHLKRDDATITARVDELAALTHFPPDGLDRYPAQLSGGQKQRVALMRALMLDPDLLLMDEPLGALDPMIRAELQRELKDIFATLGKTVVMVTHDLAEAVYLGQQIVLMRDGRIVQQGTIDELVSAPADDFVTQFIKAQRSPLAWLDGATS